MTASQITQAKTKPLDRVGELFSPVTVQTMFWKPRFIGDPASMLHVPLLFWLMDVVAPSRLAVLGVGDGSMFFALCQTLDKLNMAARCHGFGFWHTDGQESAPDVPANLCSHLDLLYSDLADLRGKEDVDSALDAIRSSSLDLLLIDLEGLPQGCTPDITEWLRVLKPNALLILHGVADLPDGDLRDLIDQPGTVEFQVGAGLAVLPRGDNPPARLQALIGAAPDGTLAGEVDLFFRRLGEGHQAVARQMQQAAHAEAELLALRQENGDLHKEVAELDRQCEESHSEYQGEVARFDEERTSRFQETAALTEKLESLRKEKDKIGVELAQVKRELSTQQQENESLGKDITKLRWKSEEVRSQYQAEVEHVEAERENRFQETAALTSYLEKLQKEKEEMASELENVRKVNENLQAENHQLTTHVADLLSSTSWQVTAPMRKIKETFQR